MTEPAHRFEDGAAYERLMGRWSRAVGLVFLDWLDPPRGVGWLDVGCGTGVFTSLVLKTRSPATISAIDPAQAQIAHARRQPAAQHASFRVADAQGLPFPDASFDVVASALVINFIPDRPRALAEMRRVGRSGGMVAGYVWDFAQELSPTWPLRLGLREVGLDVPQIPGTRDSSLAALGALFAQAGLQDIITRPIDVTVEFPDFSDFWQVQTPGYSPTTRLIAAMTRDERTQLIAAVRATLPILPNGAIGYSARANAIKARVPG